MQPHLCFITTAHVFGVVLDPTVVRIIKEHMDPHGSSWNIRIKSRKEERMKE